MKNITPWLAALLFSTVVQAQEEKQIDVETRHVGIETKNTQGVLTLLTSDGEWCPECPKVEKFIFGKPDPSTPSFAEQMNKRGIVFREIRNQNRDPTNPGSPRINEHLALGSPFYAKLNGLPYITIEDTGRSFNGDIRETAIKGIRGSDRIQQYLERYALDEKVTMLTGNQADNVLEAIASHRFKPTFGYINESRLGFIMPVNICDEPHSMQVDARLRAFGSGIQILDCYLQTQRDFPDNGMPVTFEDARKKQLEREALLDERPRQVATDLQKWLEEGEITFPWEWRNTRAAHDYQKLADQQGREFVFERRVPTEQEIETIQRNPGTNPYAQHEIEFLKEKRKELEFFYAQLAAAGAWYVPPNVSEPLPDDLKGAPIFFELHLEDVDRSKMIEAAFKGRIVYVELPSARLVGGVPQTFGNTRNNYETAKSLTHQQ